MFTKKFFPLPQGARGIFKQGMRKNLTLTPYIACRLSLPLFTSHFLKTCWVETPNLHFRPLTLALSRRGRGNYIIRTKCRNELLGCSRLVECFKNFILSTLKPSSSARNPLFTFHPILKKKQ